MNDTDKLIALCAGNNPEAKAFLGAVWRFCHLIDDLADEPVMDLERVGSVLIEWTIHIGGNPFYQAHRARFEALLSSACAAWLDSNRIKAKAYSGATDRGLAESDVLKGYWHEIYWQVALLTQGWNAMREAQVAFRRFDFENTEPDMERANN